jgi:hypothetical protein
MVVSGALTSTAAPGAQAASMVSKTADTTKTDNLFIALPPNDSNIIGFISNSAYNKLSQAASIDWGEFLSTIRGRNKTNYRQNILISL